MGLYQSSVSTVPPHYHQRSYGWAMGTTPDLPTPPPVYVPTPSPASFLPSMLLRQSTAALDPNGVSVWRQREQVAIASLVPHRPGERLIFFLLV